MKTKSIRFPALDIARGIMVLIMIFYHGWYLLANVFQRLPVLENGSLNQMLTGFGGSIFVFIAGISAAITWEKRSKIITTRETFTRYCLKRTAILSVIAAAITLLTGKFEPNQLILFGIIHFFAIGFLLLPIFAKHYRFNWILAFGSILLGVYFLFVVIPVEYLWIFGMRTRTFASADYYPLFPYFGVLLLGFEFGKYMIGSGKMQKLFGWNLFGSGWIRWLGKNSLLVYILHIPLLYGVFWLIFLG